MEAVCVQGRTQRTVRTVRKVLHFITPDVDVLTQRSSHEPHRRQMRDVTADLHRSFLKKIKKID